MLLTITSSVLLIAITHHQSVVGEPNSDPLCGAVRRPGRDVKVHTPTSHHPAGTVVTRQACAARTESSLAKGITYFSINICGAGEGLREVLHYE